MKQLIINDTDALKIRENINELLTTLSPNNESNLETVLAYTVMEDLSCDLDFDEELEEILCAAIRAGTTYIDGINCVVTEDCGLILNLFDRLMYISPDYVEKYFTESAVTLPKGTTYYNTKIEPAIKSDDLEHPIDLVTIY